MLFPLPISWYTISSTYSPANNPRRRASTFLLSGLLHCGHCGALMNGDLVQPKTGPSRAYYACSHARTHWSCPAKRIPQRVLEDAVIDNLVNVVLSPTHLHALIEEQNRARLEDHAPTLARRAELSRQLQAATLRATNLANAIAEAGHSPTRRAHLSTAEADQAAIRADLAALDSYLAQPTPAFTPARLHNFTHNLTIILKTADLPTRRRILHGLIDQVTAQREGTHIHGTITYYLPPSDLLTTLADLPTLDQTLTGPDPPAYAYTPHPPGGTRPTHTTPYTTHTTRKQKRS